MISAAFTEFVAKSEAVRVLSATSLVHTAFAAISAAATLLVASSLASMVPSTILSPHIEVIPAPLPIKLHAVIDHHIVALPEAFIVKKVFDVPFVV